MGLTAVELSSHIASDIGAAAVSRLLARRLDAPLILQNYSRLVIDCNRPMTSSESIAARSDTSRITGNEHLDDTAIEARRSEIFAPYHAELRSILDQRSRSGRRLIALAMHSFTPTLKDFDRPWHLGLMYRDARIATPLLKILQQNSELRIGDNEPYAIEDEIDYSISQHFESRGIEHAGIEIRQDLIADAAGQEHWSALLHGALSRLLSEQLSL